MTNLQTAATAAPRSSRYRWRLGDSLYALGDARRALSEYQRAATLSARPSNALSRTIGNAHYALGEFEAAEQAYTMALSLEPEDTAAALYRAWARHELGRTQEAVDDYDLVIDLTPNDAALFAARGDLKRLANDPDGALEDYRLALNEAPAHGAALYGLASALIDHGRLEEAAPIVERLFEAAETNDGLRANALALRGRVGLERRDFEAAEADLSALLQLRPRDADEHYNRAVARIGLGDIAGAAEDLREVVRLGRQANPSQNMMPILQSC